MADDNDAPRPSIEMQVAGAAYKAGTAKSLASGEAKDETRQEIRMDEQTIPLEELCSRYNLTQDKNGIPTGYTEAMASQRLAEFGPNKLTPPPTTPEWVKFCEEMTGFFSLLLWGGAGLCFFAYGLQKAQDNLYLGIVLATVVFVTGVFSYLQGRAASNLMDSFKNMMADQCKVVRDGAVKTMMAENLVIGDVIKLVAGDKVPADVRVVECTDDMTVDNACLTGESDEQSRTAICGSNPNPLEAANLCFFGTLVPKGKATGIVVNTGDHTVMGRIAKLATGTENDDTPIKKEIDHFVFIVSAVAIFLGVSFFIIGMLMGTDLITNLVFMIGIIVANVPEGLLATVTVSLTLTARRMATKQVLVKNLEGVETLGSTTCICSDKTGTLTQNVMTVYDLQYDNEIRSTFANTGADRFDNFDFGNATFQKLARCATLCNNATFDESSKTENGKPVPFKADVTQGDGSIMKDVVQWKTIGDASESAMIKFTHGNPHDILEVRAKNPKLCEIPFNSANKYQLSVHDVEGEGHSPVIMMKGAPERIIARCDTYYEKDGKVSPLDAAAVEHIQNLQTDLSKRGRRVLGFCEKTLDPKKFPADFKYDTLDATVNFPLGDNDEQFAVAGKQANPVRKEKLTYLGLMALIDPPRPAVPNAVNLCKTAGIKVVMVTGDHPATAKAIAKDIGIIWSDTADDIEDWNKANGKSKGDAGWRNPGLANAAVFPGWTFSANTPEEKWDDMLNNHDQIVFARTSPTQKLVIVENFQKRKEIVAVTGDGVNDSPALKKADIGIAMGIMGTEVSKEAADMILLDDNFASIVKGVEEGRLIFDNLKKSIAYTLSSNIPEISPFLVFITVQTPLPLSTVLILCVDLGTDMVPAISMAYENAESDIMKRNPRRASIDHLVTKKLVVFAYLQIGVIQAMSGFFTWMVVLNDYGYPPHILPKNGANDNWGKQQLFCKVKGGEFVDWNGDNAVSAGADGTTAAAAFKTAVNMAGAESADLFRVNATWLFPSDYPDVAGSGTSMFWRADAEGGEIEDCAFALKNYNGEDSGETAREGETTLEAAYTSTDGSIVGAKKMYANGGKQVTVQSLGAMLDGGYVPYMPFKSVTSPFFRRAWTGYKCTGAGSTWETVHACGTEDAGWISAILFSAQPGGSFEGVEATGADSQDNIMGSSLDFGAVTGVKYYTDAAWTYANGFVNVASRQMQKEALHHAQCASFIAIILVQWADLMICKTRMLSIMEQGMENPMMNFGLMFETLLGAFLCYVTPIGLALGTRPLRLMHWAPAAPFTCFIFLYDEMRKMIIRTSTKVIRDRSTGRLEREPGWMERNTYY